LIELSLRPAKAADVARLGELVRAAYRHYVERLGGPPSSPRCGDWLVDGSGEILLQEPQRGRDRASDSSRGAGKGEETGDPAARLVLDEEPVDESVAVALEVALVRRARGGG
jgi:hypothetical protein